MIRQVRKSSINKCEGGMIALLIAFTPAFTLAAADTTQRPLQQALATTTSHSLFANNKGEGFSLSSSFFSGRASGNEATSPRNDIGFDLDHTADIEGDQRVYALLIDGKYDFKYDSQNGEESALHPYIAGGVGMAMYGQPGSAASALNSQSGQSGDMVPLFRLGGGVAYRLDEKWNLSLDYKAGFSGPSSSTDRLFTGRGQQPVDLQVLNMGVRYKF